MGFKLEYFETKFEKNIFYFQPWAAAKKKLGLNLGYICFGKV
jgi:hypothetical protein